MTARQARQAITTVLPSIGLTKMFESQHSRQRFGASDMCERLQTAARVATVAITLKCGFV
jgi:hypothetical protein